MGTLKAIGNLTLLNVNDGQDGQPGQQGPQGISVTKTNQQYRLSTSPTGLVPQSGTGVYAWSNTPPEVTAGTYLWERTLTTLSDGTTVPSDAVYSITISGVKHDVDEINQSITDRIWQTDISTAIDEYNDETVTAIEGRVSEVEQDLSGFHTTVQNTYATQSSLNSEINKRKATYVTSSTAAGTRAKTGTCANFELYNGAVITCLFTNANTQSAPTLNVNSTGAIQIRSSTGAALTEEQYKWAAGSSFTLVYVEESSTNKYWRMQDSNMISRLHTDETQISQTANNVLIQATSSDSTAAAAGQHLIQSFINVAPSGVQISADKVNIAGAAIFDSYALKTEASADVEIKYAKSTSSTEFIAVSGSDGVWSDVAPAWEAGKYIWQRTGKKKVSDQSYTYTYANIQGTGVTVSEVKYAVSTTETQPADSSFTYTSVPTVAEGSWLWTRTTYSSGSKVYTKSKQGVSGTNGTNGTNSATVYLYQRASSSPAKPSSTLTYTFSTAKLSGTLGSWSQTIPSGTNPVWITIATANASATSTTDTIASSEWTNPVQLVKDGTDGSPGTDGTNGTDGYNQATVYLYRRSSTAPSKPSTSTTYTFSSGALSSIPSGWYRDIPASDGNPCYVTSVGVISRSSTYTISSSSWSTPVKLVEDGTDATPLTISSVTYAVTSNETQPSSFPYSTVPSVGEGQWLWVNILFSDATSVITKSKQGISGTSSQWYFGDKVTHMSGDATPSTGITSAVIGDMYLNNTTYSVYRCTVAGASGTARWTYAGNLLEGIIDDIGLSRNNLIIGGDIERNKWINQSGAEADSTKCMSTGFIPVTPSTKYTLQLWQPANSQTGNNRAWTGKFMWFTSAKAYINGYTTTYYGDEHVTYTATSPSNAAYVRITYQFPNGSTITPYTWTPFNPDYRWKLEVGEEASEWSLAPEDELAETQQIYYRINSSAVPNPPVAKVTRNDSVNSNWTTRRLPMIDSSDTSYKYCFTCSQLISISGGFLGCTAVVPDEAHTVIDGGNIITNSITTSQLATDAIRGGNYLSPASGDHFSIRGSFFDLSTGDIITPSFSVEGSAGGDAYFKGTINSGDGVIGGFTITDTSIYNKMESFDDEILIPHEEGDILIISDMQGDYLAKDYTLDANDYLEGTFEFDDFSGIYIGTDGIALGKGVFKINKYGGLYATNATIVGDITANSGRFGGDAGYYEVDEHGLVGYILGANGAVISGTELGYDYLMTDKIIASNGMRIMDDNDTFVSFGRLLSSFGIEGQSRFFISANGLSFTNRINENLFSLTQDQVDKNDKTITVASYATIMEVNTLDREFTDIDAITSITPYAELTINGSTDRFSPIRCTTTAGSGVRVVIDSNAVDSIITAMTKITETSSYELTDDTTITSGKNYYRFENNRYTVIDPEEYSATDPQNPKAENWFELITTSVTTYSPCTVTVTYGINTVTSSLMSIRGNIEVTSKGNPVRIINNEWNSNEGSDTMFRAINNISGINVGFGVGSGGQNHGVYSEKLGNWIIYCDTNKSVRIPSSSVYITGANIGSAIIGNNLLISTSGAISSSTSATFTSVTALNNNGSAVYSTCSGRTVALHTAVSGNRGVYDTYRGNWIIYSPTGGGVYIPQTLNVTGNIDVNVSSGDRFIRVKSGSGSLYMHAYTSTTGLRGMYSTNSSGNGYTVFTVDQSGGTYFPNYVNFGGNPRITKSGTEANLYVQSTAGRIGLYAAGTSSGYRGIYAYDSSGSGSYVLYLTQNGTINMNMPLSLTNALYTNGQHHVAVAYNQVVDMSRVYSDGKYHDFVYVAASTNDSYFGGPGNVSGLTTNTYLRGNNVKLHSSSGAAITSDRNIKKDIEPYEDKYDAFYDALKPITYKYIHGISGRKHSGFISQDVRDALISSGLTTKDFGGYVRDELTYKEMDHDEEMAGSARNYLLNNDIHEMHQLIYSEFIALNTWQIQKLKARVTELEKELEEIKKSIR